MFLENRYRSNWQRRRLPAYDASRNDRLMRTPVINYDNTDILFQSRRARRVSPALHLSGERLYPELHPSTRLCVRPR